MTTPLEAPARRPARATSWTTWLIAPIAIVLLSVQNLPGATADSDDKDLASFFPAKGASFIPVLADAGVRAGKSKDDNLGNAPILEVKDYEDSPDWGWVLQRVYLRFPLGEVGKQKIASAKLAVYGNLGDGTAPVSVDVSVLPPEASTWQEGTLTWNTQPNPPEGKPATTVVFTFGKDATRATEGRWYLSGDLADAVASAVAHGRPSIDLLLTTKIREEACLFTKEHSRGASVAPKLVIVR